jgi:ATP-dependent Clp protease adaptor protein ClpS
MAGKNGSRGDEEGKTGLITKTRPKTKKPSLYKVLLLNDDYTPMEFVVHVLERFFNKGREDATRIMLHVHQKGVGICPGSTSIRCNAPWKRSEGSPCQHSHKASKLPCIARSNTPTSAITSTPRSSISSCRCSTIATHRQS